MKAKSAKKSAMSMARLRARDPERARKKAAEWAEANPERVRQIHNAASRTYTKTHPEERAALQRKRKLATFGITEERYDEILVSQNGVCAICRRPETIRPRGRPSRLAVDHCHDTNAVRGLLCNVCNRAIGLLRDSPLLLRAAAEYLERSK
jgi:hypothetical protein